MVPYEDADTVARVVSGFQKPRYLNDMTWQVSEFPVLFLSFSRPSASHALVLQPNILRPKGQSVVPIVVVMSDADLCRAGGRASQIVAKQQWHGKPQSTAGQ